MKAKDQIIIKKSARLVVPIEPSLLDQLKRVAHRGNVPVAALVRKLIRMFIEEA